MEEYPHLHFNNSIDLYELRQSNNDLLKCGHDNQQEITLSCLADWEELNDALKLCKVGSLEASKKLYIVLSTIAVLCMMISGLLVYMYNIRKKLSDYAYNFYKNNDNTPAPINKNDQFGSGLRKGKHYDIKSKVHTNISDTCCGGF